MPPWEALSVSRGPPGGPLGDPCGAPPALRSPGGAPNTRVIPRLRSPQNTPGTTPFDRWCPSPAIPVAPRSLERVGDASLSTGSKVGCPRRRIATGPMRSSVVSGCSRVQARSHSTLDWCANGLCACSRSRPRFGGGDKRSGGSRAYRSVARRVRQLSHCDTPAASVPVAGATWFAHSLIALCVAARPHRHE